MVEEGFSLTTGPVLFQVPEADLDMQTDSLISFKSFGPNNSSLPPQKALGSAELSCYSKFKQERICKMPSV